MTSVNKIPWDKSVFFFDIDDTLIDTAHTTSEASEGIERVFAARFDQEKGKKVREMFNTIFATMMLGHTNPSQLDPEQKKLYDEVSAFIESSQINIKQQYKRTKKWSREVFIWYIVKRLGLEVAPEVIHEAADAYWITLSEKTITFPHVTDFLSEIHARKRPIYFLTSSDARLKLQDDGQFMYDPGYSEGLKRERIELLRTKGIEFHGVSIGDPEDKPDKEFFIKGISLAEKDLGYKINLENAIMFGDSYAADLQTPKEVLGFGMVVHFVKDKKEVNVIDQQYIQTGNILDVKEFLTE